MFKKGHTPTKTGENAPQIHFVDCRTKHKGIQRFRLSRASAIRFFCTECTGFAEFHPKDCTDTNCPLFPWRGKTNKTVVAS